MSGADVDAVCARLSRELQDAGAEAVVLTGSHARGEGHRHSDLDVVAIGDGPARMRAFEGRLVSEQWVTEGRVRDLFGEPSAVGQVVPGWRMARVLHDPQGIAARLRQEAEAWSWDPLGTKPDVEVAERVVGHTEEVYRLVGHLLAERWMAAAYVRSVLALYCATIMAIHLRLLYGTENRLWAVVADEMGPEWRRAQEAAFGFGGEDVRAASIAALDLYRMTAEATTGVLDAMQAETVALVLGACAAVE